MYKAGLLAGAVLMSASMVPNASAHHSFAEFDREKPVTLQGVVTKMEWSNPHSWLYVDVKDADGKTVNWGFECGAPNALVRRGLTKDSIPAGITVIVKGYQAKDGSFKANANSVTLPDGHKLFVSGAPDAPPEPK